MPRKKKIKAKDPIRLESIEARRGVTIGQRIAIEFLIHNATIPEAVEKLNQFGHTTKESTVRRWMKAPAFMRAWKAREAQVVKAITRESVIVNAQNLLNAAMEPQPIVSRKSGEVVGYKRELGHALTANEQLGKATGAFNQNQDGKTIVVIDIDFSGRKGGPIQERQVIDGEVVEEAEFTEAPKVPDWLE